MTTEELDAIEKIINEGEASIQRAPNGTLITDPLVVAWFGGMRALVAEVRRLSTMCSAIFLRITESGWTSTRSLER